MVTILNYNSAFSGVLPQQISHFDVAQNMIDAHAGNILQVGSTFYMYGDSHRCGFVWLVTSPYCGVAVYSSSDMSNWTSRGYMFDPSTWQTKCGGGLGPGGGCFNARVAYNAANNNYVIWFAQYVDLSLSGVYVLTCATPVGTCTQQSPPAALSPATANADARVFVDDDGTGYLAWTNWNDHHIRVQKLNAAYTDGVGASTDTGMQGEAVFMFKRNGVYYVGDSQYGCAYCLGIQTQYVKASTPLGTYDTTHVISGNGCGGQVRSVDVMTLNGQTVYLYSTDMWQGTYNESTGNVYYQPLTFTGDAIDNLTCAQSVTLAGLTATPPPPPAGIDQSNVQDAYYDPFNIIASIWRLQTFVPTSSTLSKIVMSLGQGCSDTTTCTPNADLVVQVTTVDGSNNPVTVLGSITFTPGQLQSSAQAQNLNFGLSGLTPGQTYAIVLSTTATQGSYIHYLYTGGTNPYPAGVVKFSANSGATWATQGGQSIMFSTFP